MSLPRLFSIFFLAMICAPGLGLFLFPTIKKDVVENRNLASFPTSFQSEEFRTQFTHYINDHFGFRRELINARHAVIRCLFGDLSMDQELRPDVLYGRNGWLYFLGDYSLNDLEGRGQLPSATNTDFVAMIKDRAVICEKAGSHYLFVVAPDKQTIYPEYLPADVFPRDRISRLSALDAVLEADPAARSHFLDLSAALKERKSASDSLYYPTDTHWNLWGAYIAYAAIINRLNASGRSSLQSLQLTPQSFEVGIRAFTDLAGMAQIKSHDVEYKPRFGQSFSPDPWSTPPLPPAWIHYLSQDPGRFASNFIIVNPKALNPQVVLIFGDSFSLSFPPFFSDTFQKVIYLKLRPDDDLLAQGVADFHPDIVIEERVERLLSSTDNFKRSREADAVPVLQESARIALDLLRNGHGRPTADGKGIASVEMAAGQLLISILPPAPSPGNLDSLTLPAFKNIVLTGWAGCPETGLPYDGIVVMEGTKIIAVGTSGVSRPDVAKALGIPGFAQSGFVIKVPVAAITRESSPQPLHVFGIFKGSGSSGYQARELMIRPDVLSASLDLGTVTAAPARHGVSFQ